MMESRAIDPRPALRIARDSRVLLLAGVPTLTVLEALAQRPLWSSHTILVVVNLATLVTFLITGVLLRDEPGQRGTSWALILAGVSRPLGWLNQWGTGPLPLYASVFGYLDDIFGAWALLRYPNHHLERHQRRFLATLLFWLVGGPAFLAVVSRPGWHHFATSSWWPGLAPDRRVYDLGSTVVNAGALVLAVIFIGLLLNRFSRAKGVDRLILTPVFVAAIVAAIAAGMVVTGFLFSAVSDDLFTIEGAAELAVPLAFLISVIQRGIARGGVADLTAQLSGPDPTKALRQALRQVLRDPTLEIWRWAPECGTYVDSDGRPASPNQPRRGRMVLRLCASNGRPLAVIIADRSAARDRALLKGAVGASRMALENAQLQADLKAKLKETRASRTRIVEASLAERRRLERNLHDGAQQRLLGLAATLQAAQTHATDPAVIAALEHAGTQLREALSELRDLARGLLPPALSHSGIGAALEEVAERLQVPVRLNVTSRRFAPAIEATAYFVICEALTNTAKHAQAHTAAVHVRCEEQMVLINVDDDGKGGADPHGAGLAALADRVNAMGGELDIVSPPGGGTHLEARIPCA